MQRLGYETDQEFIVRKMAEVESILATPVRALPAPHPRREAALAALAKMRGEVVPRPSLVTDGMAASIGDAIRSAIPYASGGAIEAEIDIAHRGADGSETAGRVRFKFSRP